MQFQFTPSNQELTHIGDSLMNLDLNQSPPPPSPPSQSPPGFESFFDEHQNPRRPIEDRIRLAICASLRQPQSTALNIMQLDNPIVGVDGESLWNCKRDKTRLAKALEMDVDDNNKSDGEHKGGFFDCNICLGMAKDPILTCCGHLFCWGCFYNVPYVDSLSKECPVCNGEVTDANVIPVYGNGNGNGNGRSLEGLESDFGVIIPPRPKARRVESVEPRCLDNSISPVADAIRNLRINLRNRDANSVVHASVNIQPRDERYAGSVEMDMAVTSTGRRRRRLR
ncbi:uncharacterized protein LOC143545034 [Bidens hawaiensis]|uniref:uncharacterized protein LOC143545034 n=1 Tax=Bidens hawaiensis TaxID=980011 RepID=UPI00404A66D7